jgi:hypothetical protein
VPAVVDHECFGVPRREDVEVVWAALDEDRLGEDLGRPRVRCDDGREHEIVRRRLAGAWIDEMMARLPVDLPTTPEGCRRRDRALAHADARDRRVAARVQDIDRPGAAVHPHVAAEIDAHAVGARRDELARDDVGREAFADAAGVESRARAQAHCVAVDLDAVGARRERAASCSRRRAQFLDRTVVTSAYQRAEDRRIETTACRVIRGEGMLDELARLG